MAETPNMSSEILSALLDSYNQYEDVLADCLIYLIYIAQHTKDKSYEMADRLIAKCQTELEDMGRCVHCGSVLKNKPYREWHQEVGAYETLCDIYCPKCEGEE